MDDDANFCNGRLRLAAFLRVVESDVPQRPTRIKPRVSLFEDHRNNVQKIQDVECPAAEESALRAFGVLQQTTVEPRDISEALSTSKSREGNAPVTHVPSGKPSHPELEHGTLRLPTLAGKAHNPGDYGVDATNAHEDMTVNGCFTTQGHERMRKKVRISHTPAAKRLLGRSHECSGTRKRRPPVHGLALLRTTTSDGLPEPGDAGIVFAVPITEIDPIQDTQLATTTSFASDLCGSHRGAKIPTKAAADSILYQPPSCVSYAVQPPNTSEAASQTLPTPIGFKQSSHVRLECVADGFVGSELNLVSMKKPRRRRERVTPRDFKPPSVVTGLNMASGSLPPPSLQDDTFPVASRSGAAELSQKPILEHSLQKVATAPSQLILTKTGSSTGDFELPRHNTIPWESAIRSQLQSITAPIRQDSNSSGSQGAT